MLLLPASDSHIVGRGELGIVDIAGISNSGRFKTENLGFVVGSGAMFDSGRNNYEFARTEVDDLVAKLDPEISLPDEKQFVRSLMAMPGKFALHFDDLELLAINGRDHLRTPVFGEEGEFSFRRISSIFPTINDSLPQQT